MRIPPASPSYAEMLWAQNQERRVARAQSQGGVREAMAIEERVVVEPARCEGVAGRIDRGSSWPKLSDVHERRTLGEAPKHQAGVTPVPAKTELGKLIDVFG